MTKLSRWDSDPKDMGLYIDKFWTAFTLLGSKEEIRDLVQDIFTHTEYKMFAKRLEIGCRLIRGDTYEQIRLDLHVTDKPISYISNVLANRGKGLRTVAKHLDKIDKERQERISDEQDYLERRKRRKLPVEKVVPELIKLGTKAVNKSIRKVIKKSSAKKVLSN